MSDQFEDMFGDAPAGPAKRRPGRPTREEAQERLAAQVADAKARANAAAGRGMEDIGGIAVLLRPVTKGTLAAVFKMRPETIAKRLIRCPSVGEGSRQLYDFVEACGYIVKPQMSPQEFIKTLNTADLPPQINKFFWDSQRTRIRFKLEAQEAWDTADVLEVFGDVFMTIKDVLQMATEEIRERARLNDDQARMFDTYIDELRETLRTKLLHMPAEKQTPSMLDQPLFGTSKTVEIAGGVYDELEEDEGEE